MDTPQQAKRYVYVDAGVNWANTLQLFKDVVEPQHANNSWEIFKTIRRISAGKRHGISPHPGSRTCPACAMSMGHGSGRGGEQWRLGDAGWRMLRSSIRPRSVCPRCKDRSPGWRPAPNSRLGMPHEMRVASRSLAGMSAPSSELIGGSGDDVDAQGDRPPKCGCT